MHLRYISSVIAKDLNSGLLVVYCMYCYLCDIYLLSIYYFAKGRKAKLFNSKTYNTLLFFRYGQTV